MKTFQMINDRGNAANNQTIMLEEGKVTFLSYGVKICSICGSEVKLYPSWSYSKTTAKHLYIFLRDYANMSIFNKNDLLRAIKDGKITEVR